MELWKAVKFCETASLAELERKHAELEAFLQQGKLRHTNAHSVLRIVEDHIVLKKMFRR